MNTEKWIGVIATIVILAVVFMIIIHAELVTDDKRFLITELAVIDQTILNEPFVYPNSSPNIEVHFVEILPNAYSEWHTHDKPLIVTVLHGEMNVYYCDEDDNCDTVKTFKANDSFVEAINIKHKGVNEGIIPVKLHIVTLNPDTNWKDKYLPEK